VGYAEGEYLSVRLSMDREPPAGVDTSRAAYLARFHATYRELERRLSAEAGVVGVTVAERFPRMYHPHRLVEVDAGGAAPLNPDYPAYRVSSAAVDVDYFDVLGVPLRSGRGFQTAETDTTQRVVIVNQSFVDNVLGGRNPIGRRVRYVYFEEQDTRYSDDDEPGPWYEVVGVAPDLGMAKPGGDPKFAGIYHPLSPQAATVPLHMAIQLRGDPQAFAPRLRAIAAAVDPALRLDAIVPTAALSAGELQFLDFWFRLSLLVSVIAMVLSLAGIYAVMSFTVARRTREIGIRVALGADPRRLVASIFRRPLTQVGVGLLTGGVLILVLPATMGGRVSAEVARVVAADVALMAAVCLLACVAPTRRALRVEPTEALRADG
jgi:putative ABC transport system permease protein